MPLQSSPAGSSQSSTRHFVRLGVGLIYGALWFFALMRFGFLAAVLYEFAMFVVTDFPFTLESSAWYAGYGYLAPAIFAAIVLYAFRYSLGGQPLFVRASLED